MSLHLKRLRMAENNLLNMKELLMQIDALTVFLILFVLLSFTSFIVVNGKQGNRVNNYRIDGTRHTKLNGTDVTIYYSGNRPVDVEINGVSSGEQAARMTHTQVNMQRANERSTRID